MSCRICLQPCNTRSDCLCKGSVGYVHPACLRRWQRLSGSQRCEICGYEPPQFLPAFMCFCLGMYAHKFTHLCATTVFLPFPFRYIAAGAYVANYCII